jgi:protein SCO1/2
MRTARAGLLAAPALLWLALCWAPAQAQALRLPAQPAARFASVAGARLPLDAGLRDEHGAAVRLGALFGRGAVVLVPGYYTCPNLCSTLFEGVLQALALSGLPAGSYRLVGLSIDPRDGARAAQARRAAYASLLPGGRADLSMLTGDAQPLARVREALGYRALRDPASGELAHAAGFVVARGDGRIAAFFPGVRFDPAALRAAVLAAGAGAGAGTGAAQAASLGERLLLLCAHYDPAVGRHAGAALAAVRAAALLVALGLGGWMWRRRVQENAS